MFLDALFTVPNSFELQAPVALWLAIGLAGSLAGAVAVHLDNRRFRRGVMAVPSVVMAAPLATAAAIVEADPVAV